MNLVLFVCTGNYYRSRFAEYLFNYEVRKKNIKAKAYSKGIEAYRFRNEGPLSKHVSKYFDVKNIPNLERPRYPFQFIEKDFEEYSRVIFMDKEEHYPLVNKYFPRKSEKPEYWDFPDDYVINSDLVLPRLEQRVNALVAEF